MNRNNLLGYSSALVAAMCYGTAAVLIKKGVSDFASPLVGATLALLAGTISLSLMSATESNAGVRNNRRAIIFLALSGIMSATGVTANYLALSYAPVVVVSPISSANPLVSIIGAHFLLRHFEPITKRTIIGALLVL